MPRLRVNEIFGPTIQGEGPNAGQQAVFLRTSGCNLTCVWCDTKYTWDWKQYNRLDETHPHTVDEVLVKLADAGLEDIQRLVITGGEPLMQADALNELLAEVIGGVWGLVYRIKVEIETNGTYVPTGLLAEFAHFNVSPKLENSGVDAEKRNKREPMFWFSHVERAVFKFVICDSSDLEEVESLVEFYRLDRQKVWLMPEGTTSPQMAASAGRVADLAVSAGFNFTSRLQVLAWPGKRAV